MNDTSTWNEAFGDEDNQSKICTPQENDSNLKMSIKKRNNVYGVNKHHFMSVQTLN